LLSCNPTKENSMKNFGQELVGKQFRTGRVTFTVLSVKPYPEEKVSDRYKSILDFREGLLVAVKYHDTCLPNVTLKGGVAQLTRIKVGDQEFSRPGEISKALGIKLPMVTQELHTL
jgi:hypothetical protein